MDKPKGMRPETLAVAYGYDAQMGMGSVKPPIFMTSTFVYPSAQHAKDVHEAYFDGTGPLVGQTNHIYSRLGHPGLDFLFLLRNGAKLDRMEFFVYETQETIKAVERPIVIITSNNEKELPDAFLRRCFFHYIKFPDRDTMQSIIDVHFPDIQKILVSKAMDIFYEVRDVPGLKKKPSTSELLDWLKLLLHEDMPLDVLQSRDPTKAIPPLHGALLKNEQDVMLFERLAFMARRQGS